MSAFPNFTDLPGNVSSVSTPDVEKDLHAGVQHLVEVRVLTLVHELIIRGMRPTLVSSILPVPQRVTSRVYRTVFNKSASSGQPPTSSLHYLTKSDSHAALGGLMGLMYARQVRGATAAKGVCPIALCATVDWARTSLADSDVAVSANTSKSHSRPVHRFIPAVNGPLIEFCYYVVQDIRIKTAFLTRCQNAACGHVYITHQQSTAPRHGSDCPWCRLSKAGAGLAQSRH